MTYKNHPALLPNGLSDLLPPQAENESRVVHVFMEEFAKHGYQRVKPPLVEFEEGLLGEGPGQSLARQTFRMMDPVSGRMMGIRADVTAQIARISTSRLSDAPRPLRLSYAADVLRVNGTQLRPERQFCQVGCEMIGDGGMESDVESALLALTGLYASGIRDLSIDLTVPTIIRHVFDACGDDENTREHLSDLIGKRDADAIAAYSATSSGIILSLMKMGGDAKALLQSLKTLPQAALQDMQRLLDVAGKLREALDVYGLQDVQITIDPLEHRGLEYHTGVSFSIFAKNVRGELGGGGRYNITAQNNAVETATGFTLYMDTILRILPAPEANPSKEVAADASWAEIKSLQEQGYSVSRRKSD